MTVSSGTKITAADYNALAIAVNKVFCDNFAATIPSSSAVNRAYGWGQEPVTVTDLTSGDLVTGDKITAADWNALIDRVKLGATHVGLSSALTRISAGDRITAILRNTIETTLANIEAIKNTAPVGQITTTSLTPVSHSAGFTSSLVFQSTISFDSYKKARYFFNSGGSIEFTLAKTGGGTVDNEWQTVYTAMGTMNLKLGDFTSSGSATVQGKGFEDLTFGDQVLASITSGVKSISVSGKITNSSDSMISDSAQAVKLIVTFTISQTTSTASTGTHTLSASSNKASNIPAATGSTISFAISGPTYTSAVQSFNNSGGSPTPAPTPAPTPSPGSPTPAPTEAPTSPPTVVITTSSPLPQAVTGSPYSVTLSSVNGVGPFFYEIISGSLPPGLTLSTGGTISGTPTNTVTSSFTIQSSAGSGANPGTKLFQLEVALSGTPAPTEAATPAPTSGGGGIPPGPGTGIIP